MNLSLKTFSAIELILNGICCFRMHIVNALYCAVVVAHCQNPENQHLFRHTLI